MELRYAELTESDMAGGAENIKMQITAVLRELGNESCEVTLGHLWNCMDNPLTSIQVAYDGDTIVGMVVANVIFMPDDIEGRIDDVAVLPQYRGLGVARTLMENAIIFCGRKRVTEIELTCARRRKAAGKLYESLGFKKRKTRVYTLALTD